MSKKKRVAPITEPGETVVLSKRFAESLCSLLAVVMGLEGKHAKAVVADMLAGGHGSLDQATVNKIVGRVHTVHGELIASAVGRIFNDPKLIGYGPDGGKTFRQVAMSVG